MMHGGATQALIASTPVTFFSLSFIADPLKKKNTIVFLNRVIWKSTVNTCVLGNMVRDRGTAAAEGSVWGRLKTPSLVIRLIFLRLVCLVVLSEGSVNA